MEAEKDRGVVEEGRLEKIISEVRLTNLINHHSAKINARLGTVGLTGFRLNEEI